MSPHFAKKRFGQNFLVDDNIIEQIVNAIAPNRQDHLLEIGPGMGAITVPLLSHVGKIDAVELDKDLIPVLQQKTNSSQLTIHQQDILTFDLHTITHEPHSLRIVGNLPYNISTPLLFHLFEYKELIIDMHFMLQQEVAQRLAAEPGSKQYGRLTIMAQYHCDVELLVTVPPQSFRPAPKVYSSFVRLTPKQPLILCKDINALDTIVRTAFSKRRKTLSNALKGIITTEQILALGINPLARPEQIAINDFVRLGNLIHP